VEATLTLQQFDCIWYTASVSEPCWFHRALQKVLKPEEKAPGRDAAEYEIALLGKLGWGHWEKAHRSLLADSFPPLQRLF